MLSDTAAPLIADRDQGSPRTRRRVSGSASNAQPRSTSQSGTLPRLAPALGRRPSNGFRRAAVAPVARRNRVQGCGHGQTKLRDGRRTRAPPCTASLRRSQRAGICPSRRGSFAGLLLARELTSHSPLPLWTSSEREALPAARRGFARGEAGHPTCTASGEALTWTWLGTAIGSPRPRRPGGKLRRRAGPKRL